MRDVPDYMLEPEDTSIAELAYEQAEADAWEALLEDGDPSPIIEDYAAEDAGEVFELVRAYRADRQDLMMKSAFKMAVKLEGIIEGYLYDS